MRKGAPPGHDPGGAIAIRSGSFAQETRPMMTILKPVPTETAGATRQSRERDLRKKHDKLLRPHILNPRVRKPIVDMLVAADQLKEEVARQQAIQQRISALR